MKRKLHLIIVTILSYSLIFLPVTQAAEGLALPAGDLVAPVIKHMPITTKIAPGEIATIKATVTDNVSVRDVTVFYRNIGAVDFKRTRMVRESGTDDYSTSLPEVMSPGVEYYIQATDGAGNTILHGHTFSPLTIAVSDKETGEGATDTVAIIPTTPQEPGAIAKPEKGISKWVWIGLGVLAVGALAGGDDGGSDDGTLGKTGTVTITGQTP